MYTLDCFFVSAKSVAIGTLLFAYTIEILQYLNIVDLLGLSGNRPAEIIIGTGFSWWDMLAYTLVVLFVYYWDTGFLQSENRA